MGFLWFTGGSLWVTQRRARSNLAYMIGGYGVFDDTAASIEADFGDQVLGPAPLQMGRLWVAYVRRESCFLVPMPQIVWAYETTDGISLNTRSGNHYHAKLSPAERAATVSHLKRVMPWIAFGYGAAMVNTWRDDRADMLALIDRAHAEGVTFDSIAHPGLRSGS
ncbi:MAG: hypothetical protein ABL883_08280 [Terricaulis sp.]